MKNRPFLATLMQAPWTFRLILGLSSLALYAATTVRDILPADSGEFQFAAAGWGILHPPGYPLYTVVSALWVRLAPWGTLPFRLNLLSALLAALTLVLVAETTRRWAAQLGAAPRAALGGALAAALLLGTAPTFWAQATTANIRIPTLLFGAWGYAVLCEYDRRLHTEGAPAPERQLPALALVLGLGVGHHPSLLFIAIGWGFYMLISAPRKVLAPRAWLPAVGVGIVAWALPQLYLPLRGGMPNVPLADPGLNTWDGFWNHALARGFSGDMLAFGTPEALALRAPLIPGLFVFQFPVLTLLAATAGWAVVLRRRRDLGLALLVSWAIHTYITITYRAPQTVEYLMPAYLPIVLVFGLGIAALLSALQQRQSGPRAVKGWIRLAPAIPAGLLVLFRVFPLLPDFLTLAADQSIRERVAPLLEQAPPGALILADWHWATPLWVLQATEGLGDTAEVAYVYPVAGKDYDQVWQERIAAAGSRPLFTTHALDAPDRQSVPVGGGFRLYARPLTALPSGLDFVPLEPQPDLGPVRLLGYRLVSEWRPGRTVEMQLVWQAQGAQEPPPSFAARLFAADGTLLAQADRNLQGQAAPGEVAVTVLTLLLPIDRCTPAVVPRVGVYTVRDGAFENLGEATLPEQAADCRYPTLPTERFWPGIALGAGPLLTGVDYHVAPDGATTAYLRWCGPGKALEIHTGETLVSMERLWPGQCRTVRLPTPPGQPPSLTLTRPGGGSAGLLSLPLPAPRPGETYLPFGDAVVLTGASAAERAGQTVLTLRWRTARPWVDDYAVSVRPFGANGAQLGAHDIQPALSTIPTLKWVTRGLSIPDPHPFADLTDRPAGAIVALYERFRMGRLPSAIGDVGVVTLP